MAEYWTASEQQVVLRNRSLGAGRLYGASPAAPVGRCHAVAEDASETMCGLPLDDLYRFEDTPFTRPSIRRCTECSDALRVAG